MKTITLGKTGIVTPQNAFGALPVQRVDMQTAVKILRRAYEEMCAKQGVKLVMPPLSSCGDNAGMIALVALDRYNQRKFFDLTADAQAHSGLDDQY